MQQKNIVEGKKILLIIEPFHGYGERIEQQLLSLGASLVVRKEAVFYRGSFRDKITPFTFIYCLRWPNARRKWTRKVLNEINNYSFDILFVVENLCFTKSFLDDIKVLNPGIRTILFLWDTFRTQQSRYFDFLPKFDSVYTFDRDDAVKYHLKYYPDFYIPIESDVKRKEVYDISFIGTMHPKSTAWRCTFLSKFKGITDTQNLKTFYYLKYNKQPMKGSLPFKAFWRSLQISRSYLKLISNHLDEGFLYDEDLSIEQCNEIFRNSKAILDINHKQRQGLTINAITALAYGKKLVTTNSRISEESFYDKDMIQIISDGSPTFDSSFLDLPNKEIDMSHLRLDNWLIHILSEK